MTAVAALFIVAAAPAIAGPKEDLMAADRAFARMSLEKGYDQSYIANLATDGQTFTGAAPIKNKADAVARLADPKAHHADPRVKSTWVPDTGGVSADGTLGWTEGHSSHTGPGISSNTSCVATNTAKDSNWNKVVTDAGNSLSLTAPTTPNVYSYSLTCSVPTGGASTASASLYVGLPAPIATDCGALKADKTPLPTLSLTDANASVATGSGGLCVFCSISQPQNVLNQDPTNFAVLNTPVGLFANESVTVTNNTKFTAGHTAGFIASQPGELLTLALLKQLSVTTLLHGAVQETAGGTQSLPLHLDLLTLLSNPNASFVSFQTNKDFDGLRLTDSSLLSALEQVNVYQACVSTP